MLLSIPSWILGDDKPRPCADSVRLSQFLPGYLEINVKIYQGRDVDIILLKENTKIWESVKVGLAYHTTIKLPGVGSYEIRIDNSYSVITSKNVEAKVVLHYSQEKVFETCG